MRVYSRTSNKGTTSREPEDDVSPERNEAELDETTVPTIDAGASAGDDSNRMLHRVTVSA